MRITKTAVALFLLFLFALPGCAVQAPATPTKVEKDYTGVFVAELPLDEQIKIARCVKLSSIVGWGEGGLLYGREVAEAFLHGHFPSDFDKYPPFPLFSSLEKRNKAVSFLHQRTMPCGLEYRRYADIYVDGAAWGIQLVFDLEGNLLAYGTYGPPCFDPDTLGKR